MNKSLERGYFMGKVVEELKKEIDVNEDSNAISYINKIERIYFELPEKERKDLKELIYEDLASIKLRLPPIEINKFLIINLSGLMKRIEGDKK